VEVLEVGRSPGWCLENQIALAFEGWLRTALCFQGVEKLIQPAAGLLWVFLWPEQGDDFFPPQGVPVPSVQDTEEHALEGGEGEYLLSQEESGACKEEDAIGFRPVMEIGHWRTLVSWVSPGLGANEWDWKSAPFSGGPANTGVIGNRPTHLPFGPAGP